MARQAGFEPAAGKPTCGKLARCRDGALLRSPNSSERNLSSHGGAGRAFCLANNSHGAFQLIVSALNACLK